MIKNDKLNESIEKLNVAATKYKEVADLLVDAESRNTAGATIRYLEDLKNSIERFPLAANYASTLNSDITGLLKSFIIIDQSTTATVIKENEDLFRNKMKDHNHSILSSLNRANFNFNFFVKLDFFTDNIVAIGANGSGKTSLSNKLKEYLPNSGVVISAQKVLIIPTFYGISNHLDAQRKLLHIQENDKTNKVTYSTEYGNSSYDTLKNMGDEFQVLLDSLLAKNNLEINKWVNSFGKERIPRVKPETLLDKALKIWNLLIGHRIIECDDGINITLKSQECDPYPAYQMSDGEKVILYLTAQVLQAPNHSFVIIDEPEMYLHKTILSKLWDILEKERKDCIFIYLTHDLDFAISRTTAKKVWIKSYEHPDKWEIEHILSDELPEPLLLELLGSRKNILFCEGKDENIDEKIYNLIYPEYTIVPVEGCFNVINYTKAFNKLNNVTTKAFGIIDSDHHNDARIKSLKKHNIFSIQVSEVENLLLDLEFLNDLAKQICLTEDPSDLLEQLKNKIMNQFEKDISIQASHYVAAKINYFFTDSNMSKGENLDSLNKNYKKFVDQIKIEEWYSERVKFLMNVVEARDYQTVLKVYNNKGLKSKANECFKISDFINRALNFIQFNPKNIQYLKKHFPPEL
ncbi:AAA family ATPase [Aquimarina sp. 2-A2]|uniref:AAA family ATPase n=1 Tax=Aquimarina sp. 2-A2 TaxID=3382644 RepID=UPI00387F0EE8